MNIYIFENVDVVDNNYSSEGGFVVIAKDRTHVQEQVDAMFDVELEESDWENVEVYELEKDVEPKSWIFPDVGCY